MALGERIKECRQKVGMSQEKVAELVGVSRQAVTKWESNQSAPNTENLFKLAEIFGISVDILLESENETKQSIAEQIYSLYKKEEEKKSSHKKQALKRNVLNALYIFAIYIGIYLLGRIIWCDLNNNSFTGWLFTSKLTGEHSYLIGWLLSSNLFWYSLAISTIPSLFGKNKFSLVTAIGFVFGIISGMIFGPYPEGAAIGHDHYGWAIWGVIFIISIIIGIFIERYKKKDNH